MVTSSKQTKANANKTDVVSFLFEVLDATTLFNLEILSNSRGGKEGSLLDVCDRCSTHFGKRLLARWLSAPLCNVKEIAHRLDAIDVLREKPDFCGKIREKLKAIPDLEKSFCR